MERRNIHALRGTEDLLGPDMELWTAIETCARAVCRRFGFQEIRTPLIEDVELFTRSVGDTTDIVQKEMYAFPDRGGRTIALRPEGTASMVRAYVEHELYKTEGLVKWFSIGPMFRGERPQAGRRRQFHQIGVETIGGTHPLLDAELILLAQAILHEVRVADGAQIRINNIGCRQDRQRAGERLRSQLSPHQAALCADCQERLTRNVFRVLDCKRAACREIVRRLIVTLDPCAACQHHHARVREALTAAQLQSREDATMVRGLDYYTTTVFEINHERLGAQDAVGAGGRYDDLVEELGGPAVGASGFALGIERILIARQGGIAATDTAAERTSGLQVAVLALDEPAQSEAFQVLQELRQHAVVAAMDFGDRSLKAQMRWAHKLGAQVAVLLGAQERAQGTVTLKRMLDQGEAPKQRSVPRQQLLAALHECLP